MVGVNIPASQLGQHRSGIPRQGLAQSHEDSCMPIYSQHRTLLALKRTVDSAIARLLFRRGLGVTGLGSGRIGNRLNIALFRPEAGTHPHMYVHCILTQFRRERGKRLRVHYSVDPCLVDFTRPRTLFDLDQLSPAVCIELESNLHRFSAWGMPNPPHVATPAAAD